MDEFANATQKVVLLTRKKAQDKEDGKAERRAEPRVRFDEEITLWRRHEGVAEQVSGWSLNLSSGGIRIVFHRKLDVGEEVGVGGLDADPATVPGRVVWVSPQTDGCVAGIAFDRIPPALL